MTPSASRNIIEIRGLRTQFGSHVVHDALDLDVRQGEILSVVGGSGSGKSVLLRTIVGLNRAAAGSVRVFGQDLLALSDAERRREERSFGVLFQQGALFSSLTVTENVALPLMLLEKSDPARVQQMLAAVGLGEMGGRLPQQLSGGQLQRVAIARALVHRPALLLADEPTGNLDPTTATRVMDLLLAQTREHGASLVLVTHSDAAAARADRVLRLTASGIVE